MTGTTDTKPKMNRKLKSLIVFLSVVASIAIFIGIYNYLSKPYHIHYDDMRDGVRAFTDDEGNYRFELPYESKGSRLYGNGSYNSDAVFEFVLFDYEKGVRYTYKSVYQMDSRLNVWFRRGTTVMPYLSLTPSGQNPNIEGRYDPNKEPAHTAEYYKEHQGEMTSLYLRVYWENPDGTFTLFWEHPDAAEIAERCGVELSDLPEPQDAFHPSHISKEERDKIREEAQKNQGE